MAKKVRAIVKLQIEAGKATPAPPVGPALGQHGVNIMAFCKDYNDRTSSQAGIVPVDITIYEDRTFTFVTKTAPVSDLLKRTLGVEKGSQAPNRDKVGRLSRDQVAEIAKVKMRDLNSSSLEAAMRVIEGTARSMGIEVERW